MDYAFVMALILLLWFTAKCTRRLLTRLEPPEQAERREMIVVKMSLNGGRERITRTSHRVELSGKDKGEKFGDHILEKFLVAKAVGQPETSDRLGAGDERTWVHCLGSSP